MPPEIIFLKPAWTSCANFRSVMSTGNCAFKIFDPLRALQPATNLAPGATPSVSNVHSAPATETPLPGKGPRTELPTGRVSHLGNRVGQIFVEVGFHTFSPLPSPSPPAIRYPHKISDSPPSQQLSALHWEPIPNDPMTSHSAIGIPSTIPSLTQFSDKFDPVGGDSYGSGNVGLNERTSQKKSELEQCSKTEPLASMKVGEPHLGNDDRTRIKTKSEEHNRVMSDPAITTRAFEGFRQGNVNPDSLTQSRNGDYPSPSLQSKPPARSIFFIADKTFTAKPSDFAIESALILPGGLPLIISNTPIRLAASEALIIGSSTIGLKPTPPTSILAVTLGGEAFTPHLSGFSIRGTSLVSDGAGITISNTPIRLVASYRQQYSRFEPFSTDDASGTHSRRRKIHSSSLGLLL